MSFNMPLKGYWTLISINFIIITFLKDILGIYVFIILSLFTLIKHHNKQVIFVLVLMLLPYVNLHYSDPIDLIVGKVDSISDNYIIVKDKNKKVKVNTSDTYIIDSKVTVLGKATLIEKRYGFYNFDFKSFMNQKGVYYEIKNPEITLINKGSSIQSFIHKRIISLKYVKNKEFLYRFLLNLKSNDEKDIFIQSGLPFIGLLGLINITLKKYFYKKTIKKIELLFIIILNIVYSFKTSILRLLIFKITSFFKIDKLDKVGICLFILLLIDKYQVYNLGFWIILSFLFNDVLFVNKQVHYLFLFIVQGVFNKSFNIINSLLYKSLSKLLAFGYIASLFTIFFDTNLFFHFFKFINFIYLKINYFTIYGYPIGVGLIIFIIIFSFNFKYKWTLALISYSLILNFGYINLLAEVTFINVGQGDSILIRSFFNKTNILIDTGSKYQYSYLKQFLLGKGIKQIDLLLISHSDEDHSGNIDNLKTDFNVKKTITNHFIKQEINDILVYDINHFNGEDDNDNSLVNLIKINGLTFLFTGDISEKIESKLLKDYDSLDVDILKVAHHGSHTGTSKDFLKTITPKLAIISSGKNNKYNHPAKKVTDLLENEGVLYFDTKYQGDISIYFLFKINFFYTSDRRIGIIKQ